MGTLEKVIQLKNEGQTDAQIIENLRQHGISPREINEALSQSKIKSAVNEQGMIPQQSLQTTQDWESAEVTLPESPSAQMQPSMMQQASEDYPEIQQTQRRPQFQQPSQFTQPMQAIPSSFQPSTTSMPSPEAPELGPYYPEYYEYPTETSVETINEIATQIVDEKTAQLKKQISLFTGFREEIALEVEKMNERLSKIENTLNQLQTAILRKIGDYGEDIQNIAKEMRLTQDSFSKILNPLTDNIRELQKIAGSAPEPQSDRLKLKSSKSKSEKKSKSKKGNPKPSFEDYLR